MFKRLDEAINFYQSDKILEARNHLLEVFQAVSNPNEQFLKSPTKYGLYVVERGIGIFLEDDVSCFIVHGTILLDSSNRGAQFYASLLNVVGAFAMVISEFQVAQTIFSTLIDWHKHPTVTSRTRDLGAVYNNSGCLALVMGELSKAKDDFKKSLEQFEKQRHKDVRNLLDAITTSRRFKCVIPKWAIPLDFVARRLVLFLWAFTSGATERVLNKFGFIRFGKGEIFWMKTLKRLERNGTIA